MRDSFDGESRCQGDSHEPARDDRQDDLFRPALEESSTFAIRWCGSRRRLIGVFWRDGSVCRAGPGQPPLPTRLVAGLFILKQMHNLSDEMLCDRWVENPYFQYFCGEVVFRHEAPFDRSSRTRWRQRLGEEQIAALLQESLSVAHRTGRSRAKISSAWWRTPPCRRRRLRIRPMRGSPTGRSRSSSRRPNARASSCARVICVWPNALPLAWGAIRMHNSSSALGGNSNSCAATWPHHPRRSPQDRGRCGMAGSFWSAARSCIAVRHQEQRQRGPKVYSLHAPEVDIGRGKARASCEFGCKVSIATPATAPKGAQFVLHAKALHGNPYDGHTLGPVITDL